MRMISIFAWALAVAVRCSAGTLPDDPRLFPVLISHEHGMGSGCLLRVSNSVYLATAKHVLFSMPEGTSAPALLSGNASVRAYSRAGTTNVSDRTILLDLAQLLSLGEIRYSTNRDVALVRFEDCNTNDYHIVRVLPGVLITSSGGGLWPIEGNWLGKQRDVDVGAEVYMFGYPVSLTGPIREIFDPAEPLLRRGIVAGVNVGKRSIIIDCPAYLGNSGGPVIQVLHPALDVTSYQVIGLVSGFVPFQEEWENKTLRYSHVLKSNSGYTVVEPIDIAIELVWK
jgi:hypothetical protein